VGGILRLKVHSQPDTVNLYDQTPVTNSTRRFMRASSKRNFLSVQFALLAVSAAQAQRYTFELFQVPRAPITTATAINNLGQIVGIAQGLGKNVGFLKNGSTFTLIDVPGAGPLNGTIASGINDGGQIVGSFVTENLVVQSHGFVQASQTLTTFDVPASDNTEASGINNAGQIVGRFFPAQGAQIGRGFIKDGSTLTLFDAPGVQAPFGTFPFGINDKGQIVGQFLDTTGFHSFLLQSNNFSLINVPGSGDTQVQGINNSGQVAGSFRDGNGMHGFVTINGRFFQIDVPGVTSLFGTYVFGINDSNQVVGRIDVSGLPGVFDLGFVATPCSGTGTNCITLPEISPGPGPLVINCPDDIVLGCNVDPALAVTFSVSVTNGSGPAPVVVCSPPSGSLFAIGTNVVGCTASDDRGNQTNCEFRIIRLPVQFIGFLDPLNGSDASGGSFSAPLRTVKLGSTLPVKFIAACDSVLLDNGISSLQVTKYASPADHATPLSAKARGSQSDQFSFDDGEWQFNLDTRGSSMIPGTWLLTTTLPDGSQHSVWIQIRD